MEEENERVIKENKDLKKRIKKLEQILYGRS
jgi:cell division septum initiation protein DivIVA